MNRTGKLVWHDGWVMLVLFLASLALRAPFRSQYAFHWDSAEFSLAVTEYNVALSQPHAPGYFLYVMMGRLVNFVIGDPHTSLVWLSVVFGSGLTAILYRLGVTLVDRRTGWAAALIAMTSPQCWFHSCVALTYVVDAFLVCLTVWLCWRSIQRGGGWLDAVFIGGALAVTGGVRQQTVPGLLPLVLYTFWKFQKQRAAKLIVAGAVALAGAAFWLIPMIHLSGGVTQYWEVVQHFSRFHSRNSIPRQGVEAILQNLADVTGFLWIGLLLAVLLIVGGLFHRTFCLSIERRQCWDRAHGPMLKFLAWWMTPLILLTIFTGFADQPGQVFSFLPAFILLAGVVAAQLPTRWLYATIMLFICAVNSLAFLAWPGAWKGLLFYPGCTAQEIRQHDELWQRTISLVRAQFKPAETLICHSDEFFNFGIRQFQLYLPEYDQYLFPVDWAMVSPPDRPMLSVREGRFEFAAGPFLQGKRQVLLVVPPPNVVTIFGGDVDLNEARPVAGSEGTLFTAPVAAVRADAVARAKHDARQQQEKPGL